MRGGSEAGLCGEGGSCRRWGLCAPASFSVNFFPAEVKVRLVPGAVAAAEGGSRGCVALGEGAGPAGSAVRRAHQG